MLRRIVWTALDPFLLRITRHMDTLILEERIRDARRFANIGPNVKLYPTTQIRNFFGDPKAITIGDYSHILCELLVFWDGGSISIGEWCHIREGTRILSQSSVTIGNRVGIAHLVDIHDTDCHPLDWEERRLDVQEFMSGKYRMPTKTASAPVVIEDDVWVGFKATISKGVRIGRGAIIAAGSVVVEDVPPFTLAAGNPAKVVREIKR